MISVSNDTVFVRQYVFACAKILPLTKNSTVAELLQIRYNNTDVLSNIDNFNTENLGRQNVKKYIIFFGAALTFGFMSCKSTKQNTKPDMPAVEQPTVPVAADNSAALNAAETARRAAVKAGADKAAPDQFNDTDARYNELTKRSKAGENVTVELADVTARYRALEEYTKASALKNRIDELGFQSYDKTNYNKGANALSAAERLSADKSSTGAQLYEQAHTAYTSLNTALQNAFKTRAREERTAAFGAKRNADSVYAAVAQKKTYDSGVADFRSGDTSYAQQDAENALKHYGDARKTFEKLYADISEKRAAAQEAIEKAKAKVAETSEYAVQADKDAPLSGSNIKGIEDENAVLLKAETYDDPTKAAQAVPETVSDTEAAK